MLKTRSLCQGNWYLGDKNQRRGWTEKVTVKPMRWITFHGKCPFFCRIVEQKQSGIPGATMLWDLKPPGGSEPLWGLGSRVSLSCCRKVCAFMVLWRRYVFVRCRWNVLTFSCQRQPPEQTSPSWTAGEPRDAVVPTVPYGKEQSREGQEWLWINSHRTSPPLWRVYLERLHMFFSQLWWFCVSYTVTAKSL